MMFMNLSLYERIGGAAMVEAATNKFYVKVMENRKLKPYFKNIDIPEQESKLRKFLMIILRGNTNFNREHLRKVHTPLVKKGLSELHCRVWIRLMSETLSELDVPQIYIEEFVETTELFFDDILVK